jgi:RND family efflux transporter MFP subunit
MTAEQSTDPADPAGAGDDKAQGRRHLMMAAGGFAVVAAVVYAFSHSGGDKIDKAPIDRSQAVTAAVLALQPFERTLTFSGEARPVNDVHVYAPAAGVRIVALLVDEGDRVRAGQPLARLDTPVAQAQTLSAQAAVKEAEVAAVRARDEFARAESIRDSGALSAEAIASRKAQAEAAEARLAAAKAQAAEVNARMQGGYVRAPQAGLVIDRMATLGAPVDGQALFRIAGGEALEVSVEVSEADILAMKVGAPAQFTLVDGTPLQGKLRRLPASVDSRSRAGEAVFALPRHEKLRAGMFLRGRAALGVQSVLAAPQSSVIYDAGDAYMFVVEADQTVRRAKVQLGERAGDRVAVRGGLSQGALIVASGAAFLQDGDKVRVIDETIPPAAAAAAAGGG